MYVLKIVDERIYFRNRFLIYHFPQNAILPLVERIFKFLFINFLKKKIPACVYRFLLIVYIFNIFFDSQKYFFISFQKYKGQKREKLDKKEFIPKKQHPYFFVLYWQFSQYYIHQIHMNPIFKSLKAKTNTKSPKDIF